MFEREIETLKLNFLISKDQHGGQTGAVRHTRLWLNAAKLVGWKWNLTANVVWSFISPFSFSGHTGVNVPGSSSLSYCFTSAHKWLSLNWERSWGLWAHDWIHPQWMGNLSSRHSDGGLTSAFKTEFSNIRAQRKREEKMETGGGAARHCEEETLQESGSEDRSYREQKKESKFNLLLFFVNKNLYVSSSSSFILKQWIPFCLCR